MSAAHTPNPWWETEYGVRDRGGYICHTQPPTHYPGQDERYASEVAERKANKTLIAAAPDLLEALQDLLEVVQTHLGLEARNAVAAIAKATGDAP